MTKDNTLNASKIYVLPFIIQFIHMEYIPLTPSHTLTIYHGGEIRTIDPENHIVESIAVKDELIFAVGTRDEVTFKVKAEVQKLTLESKLYSFEQVDLQSSTLMPGFYDAHSHILVSSLHDSIDAKLEPSPSGNVNTMTNLINALKESAKLTETGPIIGMGYSDIQLGPDNRHPTFRQLDLVSTDRPVIVIHASFHLCAVNSKVIKDLLLQEKKDQGIELDNEGIPTGVLKENAYATYGAPYLVELLFHLANRNGQLTPQEKQFLQLKKTKSDAKEELNEEQKAKLGALMGKIISNLLRIGANKYLSHGITTAQEGAISVELMEVIKRISFHQDLGIDVRGYQLQMAQWKYKQVLLPPTNWFQVQGIKIVLDGSIQAYTAYLTQNYQTSPNSSIKKNTFSTCCNPDFTFSPIYKCCEIKGDHPHSESKHNHNQKSSEESGNQTKGSSNVSKENLTLFFNNALEHNIDVICHCNGDAAAQMMINAVMENRLKFPWTTSRITMIHAQMVTEAQLEQIKILSIIPSFFPSHIFFWGDFHKAKFIGNRAINMNPTGWAVEKNIKFTLHNDCPVVPQSILDVIRNAMKRKTALLNTVLGENQRLKLKEALRAVTIDAAYQGHEQKMKGSIEVGKLADLIIIKGNLQNLEQLEYSDLFPTQDHQNPQIYVTQTIKRGKTVFLRKKQTQ